MPRKKQVEVVGNASLRGDSEGGGRDKGGEEVHFRDLIERDWFIVVSLVFFFFGWLGFAFLAASLIIVSLFCFLN